MMTQTSLLRHSPNTGTSPARFPTTNAVPLIYANWAVFLVTLFMTYLTFVKEGGLYYNEWHNWRALAYLLAMKIYYPLLGIDLVFILVLVRHFLARRKASVVLAAAAVVFTINVALFSANNIINLLENKPLHSPHRGIGW
jgi:hypothetical protein